MIDFKEIESKVFHNKDEKTVYPEAIDGGIGYRPVSGWRVKLGHYDRDTDKYYEDKWELYYENCFNCYDGWDSMTHTEGIFDTYKEAVMAAHILQLKNELYNIKEFTKIS